MLSYKNQYQVLAGIYYAFSNNSDTRVLNVSHSPQKIEKMRIFSNTKYESSTKQDFIITCLWYIYNNSVTSLHDMMTGIYSLDKEQLKESEAWKNRIINYSMHISRDIDLINSRHGGLTDYQTIIQMYRHKEINWYTMYYYGLYTGIDMENVRKSRRFGKLIKKTDVLILYITFNEKSLKNIERKIKQIKEVIKL